MKGQKTGGRKKGTPNKENPLKGFLAAHSYAYFAPGEDGLSDFDRDLDKMLANDRVTAELKLLKFHTPEMKSTELDLSIENITKTIEDRLTDLCAEGDEK